MDSSQQPTSSLHPDAIPAPEDDCRLYVPEADQWKAQVLTSWDKVYCFAKKPGEEYYHLILHGEIYLQRGDEVFCLRCGLRDGILTRNRLFWQTRGK